MERGAEGQRGRGARPRRGDIARSGGDSGAETVRRHVVTCFLTRGGRILLLRRSGRVGTFRRRWAGVSGYIEPGEMPLERAFREIREETGLLEENVRLIRGGDRIVVPADGSGGEGAGGEKGGHAGRTTRARVVFIVHPFLFEMRGGRVRLDWEHTGLRWVRPGELRRLRTVPGLAEALESVLR